MSEHEAADLFADIQRESRAPRSNPVTTRAPKDRPEARDPAQHLGRDICVSSQVRRCRDLIGYEPDQLDLVVVVFLHVVVGEEVVYLDKRPLAVGDLAGKPTALGGEHCGGLWSTDQSRGNVARRGSDRAQPADEEGNWELVGAVAPVAAHGVDRRRPEQANLVVVAQG
jgi:hypothetical protein